MIASTPLCLYLQVPRALSNILLTIQQSLDKL